MSFSLTPKRLMAVYDCLRSFPPFSGWNLPESKDVYQFKVTRHIERYGHYERLKGTDKHIIAVSSKNIGHFDSLVQVMAHEMIHLHQAITKTETANTVHNAAFRRLARSVCRNFHWDEKKFV